MSPAFERMRVIFVIPGNGEGSSMIFARRQAAALRARDVEVREFFLGSRTSLMEMVREMFRFRRELRGFLPNIVHAQYGTATAMFCAIAALRLPLVITYRGSDLNPSAGWFGWRSATARLLSQLAALRANKIVCVSRALRDRLWWRQKNAEVLATGVDSSAFQPGSRESARLVLGWRLEARAVLFHCGRDPRVKRMDLAEAAIRVARRTVPDLDLRVLDGSTAPSLVPMLMNAADCLLVTSDFEGSPTVVQEALATNLPIVSVAVGDVAERVHGVSNTYIAARDAEALGAAVAHLIEPPRRSDGRRRIGEFSSDWIAGRLCAIYQELA
jgi:teichuronic acid biosynthesis glycosyltransferase TuaC